MTTSQYFEITTCINCPLYLTDDKLLLTSTSLTLPLGKSACLILVRDLTELFFSLQKKPANTPAAHVFSCSGCQGLIKFQHTDAFEIPQHVANNPNVGFSGQIEDLPPAELMQTINMNQKTGTLTFDLPTGSASISFNNGQIIDANCGSLKDAEAFFTILQAKEGGFQFSKNVPALVRENDPIGDFMGLLMEGLQKIDEDEEYSEEISSEIVSDVESDGDDDNEYEEKDGFMDLTL
jgi:hypothetical protein